MSKNIFYTGIGSLKSGKHTEKQFLKIMNKEFKKKCSIYKKSLKCKSCKKSIEMNSKEGMKQVKNKTYKMSSKTEKKLVKQMEKCDKCKKKNTKKCNLEDYIVYSGAEIS